ncbi:exosortase X [Botryobacter ruber]|uniref:exosortase X n=1 Tax=Botryobacter ruber TaxID=2171629 RepID=UPI000E0B6597|nr:archaeosortase/exosortase family protein [Botryobacter ruber]
MKENKKVVWFIVSALGMYLAWFILYGFWLSNFDTWLTVKLAETSAVFLRITGYAAEANKSNLIIDGYNLVHVDTPCNGMELMALFAGFIIAFPGPVLKKLIFIPIGIFLINFLNILRIAGLALNAFYSYETLEFNHKYTFTIIVYAFIFGLWMLWVKKYSSLNNYAVTTAPQQQTA